MYNLAKELIKEFQEFRSNVLDAGTDVSALNGALVDGLACLEDIQVRIAELVEKLAEKKET